MTSITQTGGNGVRSKSATFSYDSDGRLSGVTLQENGDTVAQSTYTYDDASELTDLNYVDGSNAPLAGYHWDYDAAGLVSDEYSLKDTSGTPASYAGWAEAEYNYDADAQLSTTGSTDAVTYAGSWNSAVSNTSVTYDANGNRTSTDGTNTASSTNEVLFDGQYCYQYDAAGNRIAQWVDTHRHPEGSPQPGDSDITTYTWDNANQLTEVTYQASYGGTLGTDVAYTYDALGRMVSRTDKLANTSEYYVYDGQNLALVLDAAGDVVEREFYAPAASSPLPGGDQGEGVLASEVGPATMGTQSVGTVDWYLPDNQGTVRDVVELSGTTTSEVDHIVYDGFGNITTQTTPSDQPRFTYDGMPFDSASGMYDDGVRNYAATDAVFASLDPISFLSGQTNLSEYCGNNPTNYTDPSGEQARQGVGQAVEDGNQPAQDGTQTQSWFFNASDLYSQAVEKIDELPTAVSDSLRNLSDQVQKEASSSNSQLLQSINMASVLRGMAYYLNPAVGLLTSFGSTGDPIPIAPIPGPREDRGPFDPLALQGSGWNLNLSQNLNSSSTIIPANWQDFASHFSHIPLSGLDSRVGFNINFQFAPFYPINLNTYIWVGTNQPITQFIAGRPEVNLTPLLSPAIGAGFTW